MDKEQPPKFLYHYTKIDTLQHIFKGNNSVELRFTDQRFVNDADEDFYIFKYLRKRTNELKSLFDSEIEQKILDGILHLDYQFRHIMNYRIFIMSFTELDDSTQFWLQDYAKNKGICLKLNTEKYQNIIEDKRDFSPDFHKIIYLSQDEPIENIFPGLTKFIKNRAKNLDSNPENNTLIDSSDLTINNTFHTLRQSFKFKNRTWRAEKEWRLAVQNMESEEMCYISSKGNIEIDDICIPRFKLQIENPFEEVILGPSLSKCYVDSVKRWFNEQGYTDITVSQSEANIQ